MLVSKLLECLGCEYQGQDKDVKIITDNSKKCGAESIFVCHESTGKYIDEALKNGAILVVAKEKFNDKCIKVEDTRKAYSLLCAEFFENSHKKLKLIGVTGTNGKTTVASMIYHILSASGKKCGLVGTTGYLKCEGKEESALTTPDPFELHRLFYEMVKCSTEFCVLEASSQGLIQQRLYPLEFESAIFTNITRDHLDYHGTMENYISAKKELFKNSHRCIINKDDPYYKEIEQVSKGEIITYSLKDDEAVFTAKGIRFSEGSTDYLIVSESLIHRLKLRLPGSYNVANSMAAVVACLKEGLSLEEIASALKTFYGVKGRFEILPIDKDYKVIIDYAHTPDSLKQVLLSLASFPKNRVITLFGCGGNRDEGKRAEMGSVAVAYSDVVILTADNPRNEPALDIIDDILKGMKGTKTPVFVFENRTKAIEYALKTARKNDIILLAGKGHETYQIIGDEKIPYDERKIVASILQDN